MASIRLSARKVTFRRKVRAQRRPISISLGKVLYEISMGKDRLDFPELDTGLSDRPDQESLLHLNQVLIKACANDPRRRYHSAAAMNSDLAAIDDSQARPSGNKHIAFAIVAVFSPPPYRCVCIYPLPHSRIAN